MVIVTIQLEKRIAVAYIFGIFISKLGQGQEPSLIVLFKVDKDPKISLYNIVLPLYLVINLRIESHRKSLFDAKEVAKQ